MATKYWVEHDPGRRRLVAEILNEIDSKWTHRLSPAFIIALAVALADEMRSPHSITAQEGVHEFVDEKILAKIRAFTLNPEWRHALLGSVVTKLLERYADTVTESLIASENEIPFSA